MKSQHYHLSHCMRLCTSSITYMYDTYCICMVGSPMREATLTSMSLIHYFNLQGSWSYLQLDTQICFPLVRTIWWHPGYGKMPGSLPSRLGSNDQELDHMTGVCLWHQPCGHSCSRNNRMEWIRTLREQFCRMMSC